MYDIGINRTVVQYLIIFRPLLTFGSEFKTTFFPFPFSYCFIWCGSYPFYDSKCLSSHFNKENKDDIGNTPETAVCIESSFCFIHRNKVNMLPDGVRVVTFEIILFWNISASYNVLNFYMSYKTISTIVKQLNVQEKYFALSYPRTFPLSSIEWMVCWRQYKQWENLLTHAFAWIWKLIKCNM